MLTIILLIIPFICVALLFQRGLWRNLILFVNVVLAGLLTMNYFEPVAEWLKSLSASYDFVWDIVAWWGLFCISLLLLRVVTDRLSTSKLRFIKPVDLGGSIFFALWAGWTLSCFTAASFHVAPLPRDEVQAIPEKSNFLFAADRLWLGFTQGQSRGALGCSPRDDKHPDDYVFDPKGDFLLRYATSRWKLESNNALLVIEAKGPLQGRGKL